MAIIAAGRMLDAMGTFEQDANINASSDGSLDEPLSDGSSKPDSQQSRREAFKKLAIGAAGAIAAGGLVSALKPEAAAALDGQNITIGNDQQTSQSETAIRYMSGPDAHAGVFFAIEGNGATANTASKSALNGWVYGATAATAVRNGVYGFSERADGIGVVARSSGTGLYAQGAHAVLTMQPGGVPAPTRNAVHGAGDFIVDTSGDLWYCVSAGTPGEWRKLSGIASAGTLHLLPEPLRALDTRQGSGTKFVAGQTGTISLGTGANGAGVNAPAVPVGSSAALVNVTLTGTVGNFGYIQAYSADLAAPPATSVMNWSTPEDNVANEMTVKLNPAAQIKITVGVNATHVIVDVVGYYR
jgi:hypothetical protein